MLMMLQLARWQNPFLMHIRSRSFNLPVKQLAHIIIQLYMALSVRDGVKLNDLSIYMKQNRMQLRTSTKIQ